MSSNLLFMEKPFQDYFYTMLQNTFSPLSRRLLWRISILCVSPILLQPTPNIIIFHQYRHFKQPASIYSSILLLISYYMTSSNISLIVDLFQTPSKQLKKHIQKLVLESFTTIGEQQSLKKIKQWQALSGKMRNLGKLRSLIDQNHRLLLIQFIKFQAVSLYNNSYFNRAKISQAYITCLQQVGPFYFTEIITIVSKLHIIHKHYQGKLGQKRYSQNHIDIKIIRLLEMCNRKERKNNYNFNKFQAIIQNQQDRDDLVKQLGKMLRISWALQKKKVKQRQSTRLDIQSNNGSDNRHFHELLQVQSLNGQLSALYNLEQSYFEANSNRNNKYYLDIQRMIKH